MTPKQLQAFKDELKDHVADTIRLTVNGKIEKLDQRLDNYIVSDEAWKVRAEPWLRAFENTNWIVRVFINALKITGLVGGAVGAVWTIKKIL